MTEEEPTTGELRVEQVRREREEHARAQQAGSEAEERAAERRAEKAAYLREKLEEQEARD